MVCSVTTFCADTHGAQMVIPRTFHLAPTWRTHLWSNVLSSIELIAMKIHTDIYVPLRVNCNDLGDPSTFLLNLIQCKHHTLTFLILK